MRAGACGAVIDGVTRDHDDVLKLGFPVFARGHYCADIKFEGTMRSMNMPIDVGGVPVRNGDYVFADRDGVVVVPFEHWPAVREQALRAIEKEWRIGMAVALGTPPKRILGDLGEF